jgi:hypothetical protein
LASCSTTSLLLSKPLSGTEFFFIIFFLWESVGELQQELSGAEHASFGYTYSTRIFFFWGEIVGNLHHDLSGTEYAPFWYSARLFSFFLLPPLSPSTPLLAQLDGIAATLTLLTWLKGL